MTRPLLIAGCLCAVLCLGTGEARAQRRSSPQSRMRQAIQNVQRDIQNIQKQLKPAQQELGRAMSTLGQAQTSFKQAQSELHQARKTLHERVGPRVGLPEATATLEHAKKEHGDAVDKLVVALEKDDEFQKLKQGLEDAESRMTEMKQDKSGSAGARKDRFAAASKELLQAKEAYHARLDKDPAVKPFKEKLVAAEEHLKEIRIKLAQECKSDSELHTAELSFKQAKAEFERAQGTAAIASAKVEALQERLAADYAMLGL